MEVEMTERERLDKMLEHLWKQGHEDAERDERFLRRLAQVAQQAERPDCKWWRKFEKEKR